MRRYREWAPTIWDRKGVAAQDKGDWFVAPCILTRDSDALERANYTAQAVALQRVNAGAVSDTEELRFRHWGPGWFEIVLVRPGSAAATVAQTLVDRLANYPCLDDDLWTEFEVTE